MASGRYSALASGFESLSGARRRGDSDTQAVPYFPQTPADPLRWPRFRFRFRASPTRGSALSLSSRPRSHVGVFCPVGLVFVVVAEDRAWSSNPSRRREPFRCAAKSERDGLAGWEQAEPLAPAGPLPWVVALVVSRGGGVGAPGGVGGLGTGRPGGAGVGLAGRRSVPGRVDRHGGRATRLRGRGVAVGERAAPGTGRGGRLTPAEELRPRPSRPTEEGRTSGRLGRPTMGRERARPRAEPGCAADSSGEGIYAGSDGCGAEEAEDRRPGRGRRSQVRRRLRQGGRRDPRARDHGVRRRAARAAWHSTADRSAVRRAFR
jgi:hypothetical protein